jgi:hypothetical protein
MRHKKSICVSLSLWISFIILFCGCAATDVYKQTFNQRESANTKTYPVSFEPCFKAVTAALLTQNFTIVKENKDIGKITATRYFQKGSRKITLNLETRLTKESEDTTSVYVNAWQEIERLYKKGQAANLWLIFISIPIGQGAEAQWVKEREETIEDKNFFRNFFSILDKEIEAKR